MIFKFKCLKAGAHVQVQIYSGDNDTSLGLNGYLVFSEKEFEQFKEMIERSNSDEARPVFMEGL